MDGAECALGKVVCIYVNVQDQDEIQNPIVIKYSSSNYSWWVVVRHWLFRVHIALRQIRFSTRSFGFIFFEAVYLPDLSMGPDKVNSHFNNSNIIFSVNSTPMSFSITGQGTQTSQVGTDCNTDWITIPCATNSNDPVAQTGTPSVCVDRICGMVFNSVTGASSPSVPVTSNF